MTQLTMVDRGSHSNGGVGHSNGVLGSAIVGDLSHVAVVAVGVVVDMLGPAVGEVDGVRALGISLTIAGLGSIEVGVGVVVSNGVCVSVGGDLIGVNLSGVVGRGGMGNSVDHRGVVSGGSVHNRGGMVGRGCVVNSVHNGGSVVGRGGVVGRGSVVGRSNNSMSNTSVVSTVSETVSEDSSLAKMGSHSGLGNVGHRVVGRVGGDGGAEGLGLGVAPDLTLVGLGDRHMGGLATAVASTVAGQELARGSGHKGGEANKSLERNQ